MKRFYLFIILLSLFIININGFEIYNNNDFKADFFSINQPQVYIKTNLNSSFGEVKYIINDNNFSNIIDLNACSEFESLNGSFKNCGDFSLVNLINNANGSFSGATEFEIFINNISKKIYLDFDNPDFNLLNNFINLTTKKLELQFNYSDNSNIISSVKLYVLKNSDLIFIDNLTNKFNYNFSLEKVGNLTLIFKIKDIAQNELTKEFNFHISDFFEPKILESFVISKFNSYELNFKVKDDNLNRYEIIQNDLKFSGELNDDLVSEKSIILPFKNGTINFYVFDDNGNYVVKNINLDTKIINSYHNLNSKNKIFEITSDANSCVLEKINSDLKNINFEKNSNKFKVNLDISSSGKYDLNFYCEKTGFREYFTKQFIYDLEKPTSSHLNISIENDGDLKLFWTDSIDQQSDVSYKLYRDSKVVYSGLKTKYEDSKVSYPKEYKYHIISVDKAGNEIKSNYVKAIPKKIKIEYTSNLKSNFDVDDDIFKLELNVEKNSSIKILIKNSGKKIFEKNYSNVNSKFNENLKFKNGENQVIIEIKDSIGNVKSDTYFVNYNDPILSQKSKQVQEVPKVVLKKVKEPVNTNVHINKTLISENNNNNEKLNSSNFLFNIFKFLFLFLFILFLIFILFKNLNFKNIIIIFKNSKKNNMDFLIVAKSNKNKFISNLLINNKNKNKKLLIERNKDKKLVKTIKKVNKNRDDKVKNNFYEKEKQKLLLKKNSSLSDFEKQKLSEISKKSKFDDSILKKKKLKKQIIKKESFSLESNKVKSKKKIKMNLLNLLKKKEKQQVDEFSNYINKVSSHNSWENPKEYLQSTLDKREQLELEKVRKIQEENNLKLKREQDKLELERLKQQKQLEEDEKKRIFNDEKELAKHSLDDYLNKRSKKRNFFFSEREVNRDLHLRKK